MALTVHVKDPGGRRHVIKVDPDLDWLVPYVRYARRFGVPIWRIKKIIGYRVAEGKAQAQKAQTILHSDARRFVITLLKQYQVLIGDGKKIYVLGYEDASDSYNFEETIVTLAHELAHLVHWEHTADRFVLEARLIAAFAKLAKRSGYEGYK